MNSEIWGITSFFNPASYSNKIENYRKFKQHLSQQELPLLTVELSFKPKSFELTKEDSEILIQIYGSDKNILWQKERLLNIAISHLPPTCKKIIWIDADIIFKNSNWVKQTSDSLNTYNVIQPFKEAILLSSEETKLNFFPHDSNHKLHGVVHEAKTNPHKTKSEILKSHPGYVWAINLDCIKEIGFYDKIPLHFSDWTMASAFLQFPLRALPSLPPSMHEDFLTWYQLLQNKTKGLSSFLNLTAYHLWHGDQEERQYPFFDQTLVTTKFNPFIDLKLDDNGLWELREESNPDLSKIVKKYFQNRNEQKNKTLSFKIACKIYFRKIRLLLYKLSPIILKTSPNLFFFLKRISELPNRNKTTNNQPSRFILQKSFSNLEENILALLSAIAYSETNKRTILADWSDLNAKHNSGLSFSYFFQETARCKDFAHHTGDKDEDSIFPYVWKGHIRENTSLFLKKLNEDSSNLQERGVLKNILSCKLEQANYSEKYLILLEDSFRHQRIRKSNLELSKLTKGNTKYLAHLIKKYLQVNPYFEKEINYFFSTHNQQKSVGVYFENVSEKAKISFSKQINTLLRKNSGLEIIAPERITAELQSFIALGPSIVRIENNDSKEKDTSNMFLNMMLLARCKTYIYSSESKTARIIALFSRSFGNRTIDVSPRSNTSMWEL